jgi:hypothetical protein
MSNVLVGPFVLDAIINPLPIEVAPNPAMLGPSDGDSPVATSTSSHPRMQTPKRLLDRLVAILRNTDANNRPNPLNFPVEVRANVCALLGQVSRNASGEQMETLSKVAKSILEDLSKTAGQGREGMLSTAAKKSLDGWAKAQTT